MNIVSFFFPEIVLCFDFFFFSDTVFVCAQIKQTLYLIFFSRNSVIFLFSKKCYILVLFFPDTVFVIVSDFVF